MTTTTPAQAKALKQIARDCANAVENRGAAYCYVKILEAISAALVPPEGHVRLPSGEDVQVSYLLVALLQSRLTEQAARAAVGEGRGT